MKTELTQRQAEVLEAAVRYGKYNSDGKPYDDYAKLDADRMIRWTGGHYYKITDAGRAALEAWRKERADENSN